MAVTKRTTIDDGNTVAMILSTAIFYCSKSEVDRFRTVAWKSSVGLMQGDDILKNTKLHWFIVLRFQFVGLWAVFRETKPTKYPCGNGTGPIYSILGGCTGDPLGWSPSQIKITPCEKWRGNSGMQNRKKSPKIFRWAENMKWRREFVTFCFDIFCTFQ